MAAHACPGPSNIEGVTFTNGETLNLEVLTALGEEGVHYLLDNNNGHQSVRYVSSYNAEALVYIGNYGLSYMAGMALPCMGIILPPREGSDSYTRIEREQFDFAAALCHELRWLQRTGVVGMDSPTIAAIDSTLTALGNGGLNYWTHARTVLGYNSWYTYDTVSGTWGGTGEGVDGVKGGL
jgi:hypothetical protein